MSTRATRRLLPALAALAAATALLQGCSSASASTAPDPEPGPAVSLIARSANAQACDAAPALFSAYDRGSLFTVAGAKLGSAADFNPRKYPIGALTDDRDYMRTGPKAWTSGFFPSSLWLMYQRTGEKAWLKQARTWTKALLPLADWEGTHDLGFMVGIPMELGMRLDPSAKKRAAYREAFLDAARSLSTR